MNHDDWTKMNFKQLGDKIPKVPCIYFLMNDIELVYIGQTKSLKPRIANHEHMINPGVYLGGRKIVHDDFDSVYYFRVDWVDDRRRIEKEYIKSYEPKLNCDYGVERLATVDGSFVPLQKVLMEIEARNLNNSCR